MDSSIAQILRKGSRLRYLHSTKTIRIIWPNLGMPRQNVLGHVRFWQRIGHAQFQSIIYIYILCIYIYYIYIRLAPIYMINSRVLQCWLSSPGQAPVSWTERRRLCSKMERHSPKWSRFLLKEKTVGGWPVMPSSSASTNSYSSATSRCARTNHFSVNTSVHCNRTAKLAASKKENERKPSKNFWCED